MGLGATWVGKHRAGGGPTGAASTGHRRLEASLQIERKDDDADDDDMSSDDQGDEDSRARLTARRIKHVANRKNGKAVPTRPVAEKAAGATKGDAKPTVKACAKVGAGADRADESEAEHEGVIEIYGSDGMDGPGDEDTARLVRHIKEGWKAYADKGATSHAQSPWRDRNKAGERHNGVANGVANGVMKVKKRKIRSRQKNLKKDTRPKNLLPMHLTDETLQRGRVRRQLPMEP